MCASHLPNLPARRRFPCSRRADDTCNFQGSSFLSGCLNRFLRSCSLLDHYGLAGWYPFAAPRTTVHTRYNTTPLLPSAPSSRVFAVRNTIIY
jgi:hypothetical protein